MTQGILCSGSLGLGLVFASQNVVQPTLKPLVNGAVSAEPHWSEVNLADDSLSDGDWYASKCLPCLARMPDECYQVLTRPHTHTRACCLSNTVTPKQGPWWC